MFRKGMLAILIILLMMTQFIVIAEDTVEEPYVYIISPKVGESGKTILNETLFISVYIKSDEPLTLELVKKPVFDFEIVSEPILEVVEFDVEEVKVPMFEVREVNVRLSKSEIIESYNKAASLLELNRKVFEEAKATYIAAEIEIIEDESGEIDIQSISYSDRIVYSEYIKAQNDLNSSLMSHRFWNNSYLELFDKVIFSGVTMYVEEEFPYYEYTHDNIETGFYKLSVKDSAGRVLEVLEFEVVTEQSIANEILNSINFFEEILQEEIFE